MIRVFDEHGNEVNPTYPKRARGLVKQGRARYADDADDVIVLTPNTEEKVAYPSEVHKVHTLEDTEMFEYNVNEEINETAEDLEPMEEVEAVEEVEESGLPLNEELNRLYGILENVDKMLFNISITSPAIPENLDGYSDAAQAIAQAVSDESDRLRHLADRYADMRAQTITLINKVKDDAKPKWEPKSDGFDEEAFLAEQIRITMGSYKTMCQHLNDQLRCSNIDMDEYRGQMAAVQEDCDERIKKLRNTLEALKYGG